jgi:hypothetical protein
VAKFIWPVLGLQQMPPRYAVQDSADAPIAYAVSACQLRLLDTKCREAPYLYHLISRQYSGTVAFTSVHSAFARGIPGVCSGITKKQVGRVDTWGIVALVAQVVSRLKRQASQLITETMGANGFAVNSKNAVAMLVGSTDPQPAGIGVFRLTDILPESFFSRDDTMMVPEVLKRLAFNVASRFVGVACYASGLPAAAGTQNGGIWYTHFCQSFLSKVRPRSGRLHPRQGISVSVNTPNYTTDRGLQA